MFSSKIRSHKLNMHHIECLSRTEAVIPFNYNRVSRQSKDNIILEDIEQNARKM